MKNEIPMNPLVEELLSRADGESTIVLKGFLGPDQEDSKVRLYQDLTLVNYLEILRADILIAIEGENNTEPTTILIQKNAELTVVSTALSPPYPWPGPWPWPWYMASLLAKPKSDPWYQWLPQNLTYAPVLQSWGPEPHPWYQLLPIKFWPISQRIKIAFGMA